MIRIHLGLQGSSEPTIRVASVRASERLGQRASDQGFGVYAHDQGSERASERAIRVASERLGFWGLQFKGSWAIRGASERASVLGIQGIRVQGSSEPAIRVASVRASERLGQRASVLGLIVFLGLMSDQGSERASERFRDSGYSGSGFQGFRVLGFRVVGFLRSKHKHFLKNETLTN